MRVNKIVSVLVISGLLMPLQLPPYLIAEALAEPSTIPSVDPASMTSDTAVSAENFASMVSSSESTVETMNALASIAGPVPAVDPPAEAEEEEAIDLDTTDPNDSLGDPGDPIPGDEIEEAPPIDEECPLDSEGDFPLIPEPDEDLNPPPPFFTEGSEVTPATVATVIVPEAFASTVLDSPPVPVGEECNPIEVQLNEDDIIDGEDVQNLQILLDLLVELDIISLETMQDIENLLLVPLETTDNTDIVPPPPPIE